MKKIPTHGLFFVALSMLLGVAVTGCSTAVSAGGSTAITAPHQAEEYSTIFSWALLGHDPIDLGPETLMQARLGPKLMDAGMGFQWNVVHDLDSPYFLFASPSVLIFGGQYDDHETFGVTAGLGGGIAIERVVDRRFSEHYFLRADISQSFNLVGPWIPTQMMLTVGIRWLDNVVGCLF